MNEPEKKSQKAQPGGKIIGLLIFLAAGFLFAGIRQFYLDKTFTFQSDSPSSSVNASIISPPTSIQIKTLEIDAPIVPLNLNKNGSLGVPKKASDVGWYVNSPAPGQQGPSILVGHLDSPAGKAVFYDLSKLKPGNEIKITMEDSTTQTFIVDHLQQASQNNFPTEKVYSNTENPTLRIITCAGTYDEKAKHYTKNLIVFANLKK